MKYSILFVFALLLALTSLAQNPRLGGGGSGRNAQALNIGHFYGKVVDSKTNKAIEGAFVQLIGSRHDSLANTIKQVNIATVLTQSNGDFSLTNIPLMGNFKLRVTSVGYKDFQQDVSFGMKHQNGGANTDRMQQLMNNADKDLGNLKMEQSDATLANVTVTASPPLYQLGVDRKIFNVDKDLISAGQTATEVMKQIPSLNVDIDGNVTLRNATPEIFVDGRPTTLTLDQIPADIIAQVELITNPSAKYDASSGNGGILNIILKKNKKQGYNGGIRAGVDTRGRYNLGGDINVRQNKVNLFASANFNQRVSKSTSNLTRHNLTNPPTDVIQSINGKNKGYFGFLRAGLDYLPDIRNTISVNGSFVRGNFNNNQPQNADTLLNNQMISYNNVTSLTKYDFKHYGTQLSYKHLFPKNGHDLTADLNYNSSANTNNANLNTYTYLPDNNLKFQPLLRQTIGNGYNHYFTAQSDYENPITDNIKIEAGIRAAIRDYRNVTDQYLYDHALSDYKPDPYFSSEYKFLDEVFAAYATYTLKLKNWNYQIGLRAESSNYNGTDLQKDTSFKINYPVSLFPSAFISYKLNGNQDIQVNYTRRINRPNFFQLAPIKNISDPLNINIGNPGLKPEFTHSFEFNYSNNYTAGANFLASFFFKYSTDLITRYTYKDSTTESNPDAYLNTFVNANNSTIYGLELTNKTALAKWWDFTLNLNLFHSQINNTNIEKGLSNAGTSWFAKMNQSFKLPKGYSIQFSGNYQAKTVLPPDAGNGGGGFFGAPTGSAQGYINPTYDFDIAFKKDWTWKGGNSASLMLSMNDIFRTQINSTFSETSFYTQTQIRRRDPQVARLNFTYRFGKFDINLLKRKPNQPTDQNMDQNMNGGN